MILFIIQLLNLLVLYLFLTSFKIIFAFFNVAVQTHLLDQLQPNLDLTSRDSVSVSKYRRVCVYLSACAPHFPHPEDNEIYRIVFNIYLGAGDCCSAMRYALLLNDKTLAEMCFEKAENSYQTFPSPNCISHCTF